ncbi:hypothetical protein M408DRAFT_327872 [Serendipita vermifera MAFF 305830]|uniref:Uncharacterized protein n=1 Tax=Serendipita vermifera MAFF 305830 TaxID=933852 RepID=A0A0C2WXX0_SERVB|nr:hypothetical protein M408DRAFT_327872 [Serendipita vermifera MAFF 305830]
MDLIGETHRAISEQKGPDSRMHEGAQKFLEYVPELTQTIVKSQAEFELARAKCENTISELFEKLKQAHEKKRQNELDYSANFKAKGTRICKRDKEWVSNSLFDLLEQSNP